MSHTVQILVCRWCEKKVIPNLDTGLYPIRCPDKSCRRITWNKTNEEIYKNMVKSVEALLNHHKDGRVRKKKSYKIQAVKKVNDIIKIPPKQVICTVCELFFADEHALKRHKLRRDRCNEKI